MGGAGLPGLIFAVILVVAIGLSFVVFVPWFRARRGEVDRLADPVVATLDYEVPEGQDPSTVVAALKQEGFNAVGQLRSGRQLVLINATEDRDEVRSRAREVIAEQARLNNEGDPAPDEPVRFLDE